MVVFKTHDILSDLIGYNLVKPLVVLFLLLLSPVFLFFG